ncbi:MAG: Ig-like domain-containing protein, partial [Prochlorotrichaceae cyanobacterium]
GYGVDLLNGGQYDDLVFVGTGNDRLIGSHGNDVIAGNGNSDNLEGGFGDDHLVYCLSDNLADGTFDVYNGGTGYDTLWLILTYGEAAEYVDVIRGMEAFVDTTIDHSQGNTSQKFDFVTSIGTSTLQLKNIENVEVIRTNLAPIGVDDQVTMNEDSQGISFNPLINDTDLDHLDILNVTVIDTSETLGLVTVENGMITYVPNGRFDYLAQGETATDTFEYTVTDLAGAIDTATVVVTIEGINDQPMANNILINGYEDIAFVDNFIVSDVDTTDTHTFQILTAPSEGTVVNNGDGTLTFDPGADFQDLAEGETREVTFTYQATDDSGADKLSSI